MISLGLKHHNQPEPFILSLLQKLVVLLITYYLHGELLLGSFSFSFKVNQIFLRYIAYDNLVIGLKIPADNLFPIDHANWMMEADCWLCVAILTDDIGAAANAIAVGKFFLFY